ncbi:maleylpyruvate isomerase family mycothiol-dependent enzyme [Streptomyces sp. NBC_01356]|uniref:maleylpyruvate isomerase family mycothiol-dependent enzyme n=1 Tax=Streptomyces sp. NBC_01356 TaxID=2903836 RepID=UPI002E2F6927|nr:maleylpyruvate isomerase family mycothiol-dependent enzyme [Streptomyces sp. NBC_01356]
MTPAEILPTGLLRWLTEGTDLLTVHLAKVTDVRQPSTLPGWTIGHLLTHLARNADALSNLAQWAATGVENPMYPGGSEQRASDIEVGAARPGSTIISDVVDSAGRLGDHLTRMPESAWNRQVRTGQGRLVPAVLIPWLRIREVWIHLVDLGTGVSFADLPDDLATTLLPDVIATLARHSDCPALILRPQPSGSEVTTRPGVVAIRVEGSTADLLGWTTGRADGRVLTTSPPGLPDLPAWL